LIISFAKSISPARWSIGLGPDEWELPVMRRSLLQRVKWMLSALSTAAASTFVVVLEAQY
jgi:hypothetical protein